MPALSGIRSVHPKTDTMKKRLLLLAAFFAALSVQAQPRTVGNIHESSRIKIALNYYSFNTPLRDGSETVESVIDFAANTGFAAVDATGYYFPGYPAVPSDEYINRIKYRAFWQGIQICGTGVKNDFTLPDPAAREKEKQLVKDWVVVAAKLGASTLRIFAGAGVPEGYTWEQTARWIAADIDECAAFAERYGIKLALQNHNDFLKTAEEVEKLFSMIRSQAVGLMLDIGSYRTDPYREIAQTIKYAITWQIKENLYIDGVETRTDIPRVMEIIRRGGYRGCVPIEILKPGNERQRAAQMFREVERAAFPR